MRNFNVSRMLGRGPHGSWPALALGPFALFLACSVYEDALPNGAAGGTSSAGDGGTASNGGTVGQSGSSATSGSSGSESTAGTSDHGGSAGDGAAGSGGAGVAGGGSGGGSAGTEAGGQPAGDSVVDDMEDGDPQISLTDGRNGFWYVGNDATVGGTQEPAPAAFEMFELTAGDRADSAFASHMKVNGFTGWGSVIGFNVIETQATVKPYDASAFCGVTFWGKAASVTPLRFRLPDGDTHPAGNVCKETGAANQLCYDHFSAAVSLTSTWKSFTVMFSALQQIGTGYHPADKKFKADQLYAFEWAIPGSGGKASEIWLDDVALLPCP